MKNKLVCLAVFAGALIYFLLFNAGIPITDPVEANYALTAKEMVASGDWLSPRIYGQYWFDKPIMIYWLIALAYKIFGINEFAARFPAAVFSAASVAWLFWFADKIYASRRTAFYSALILATSLEFWVLSRMIITDAVLFLFTSMSIAAFYLQFINRQSSWYVVAYAAAGLAVLTKGPVGIVLPGLIIFLYLISGRRWQLISKLQLLRGGLVFLLVAVPWYFAMYIQHGNDFVNTFLGLHNVLRATVSEHPQDNVFYYYLVLFPVSLLPWAGIFFLSLLRGRKNHGAHFSYLLVWIAGFLGFYSLMATKYLTYVFPALFPAALLAGRCLQVMVQQGGRRQWLWLSGPTVFLFAVFAAAPRFFPYLTDWTSLYGCLAITSCLIIWLQFRGNVRLLPESTALSVMAVSLVLIYSVLMPLADSRSARDIVQHLPSKGADVAMYGDYATSAVFYSGYEIPELFLEGGKKDTSGVWSGKYTMPTETIDDFTVRTRDRQEVYILVKSEENRFLSEPIADRFQLVARYGRLTLFKQQIGP
ncbi:MAG: hypothetical protein H6Q66_877 [Firmicutes bacterium]|nr:hypothetical protein [Bacillota bacterium]